MSNLTEFLELYASKRESNEYLYMEIACTRQTNYMAWLCSHPKETHPDRVVLACGQGFDVEEACKNALVDFYEKQKEGINNQPFYG